jgi:hypothetical protein
MTQEVIELGRKIVQTANERKIRSSQIQLARS